MGRYLDQRFEFGLGIRTGFGGHLHRGRRLVGGSLAAHLATLDEYFGFAAAALPSLAVRAVDDERHERQAIYEIVDAGTGVRVRADLNPVALDGDLGVTTCHDAGAVAAPIVLSLCNCVS